MKNRFVVCFSLGGNMNNEIIIKLNRILKDLNLSFAYTIDKKLIKIIIFMDNQVKD